MKWLTNPNTQIYFSVFMIVSSLIGWPVSAFTIAKEEPFVILSISWLALIYSGYSALVAALVDKRLEDKEK